MLLLAWLNLAMANPCQTTLSPTLHAQPDGPRCLAAAVATAMSLTTPQPTADAIARGVKVSPQGIDPFDAQRSAKDLGAEALVFTGPPEAAARLVEAGFAPVALVNRPGGVRHAVTVTGIERGTTASQGCGTALKAMEIFDPLTNTRMWQSAQAFADQQSAEQLMVFFDPGQREQLDDAGFPTATAEAVDRRFRAEGFVRRAQAHPTPNAQSVRLLQRAVDADPAHTKAQQLLTQHQQQVGATQD